jgi:hypothetical protein
MLLASDDLPILWLEHMITYVHICSHSSIRQAAEWIRNRFTP